MKTSMESRRELGVEKVGLFRAARPVAVPAEAQPDHQTLTEGMLRAERKKAEAITLLRSHPQVY